MRRWPEQPRRQPAPSQVTLQNAVDLLALAAPLSRPPDQLICRNAPVGHHAEDLVPASVGQLHRREWKLHLPLHSRQRLFDRPLLVAMNRYSGCSWSALSSWARSSHQPTADPCPHDAPQPCGTASASLARRPRTPHGGTPSSRRPQPQTRSPRTARLHPPRSTAATPAGTPPYPDLSITFSTPAGRRPSASINTRNC